MRMNKKALTAAITLSLMLGSYHVAWGATVGVVGAGTTYKNTTKIETGTLSDNLASVKSISVSSGGYSSSNATYTFNTNLYGTSDSTTAYLFGGYSGGEITDSSALSNNVTLGSCAVIGKNIGYTYGGYAYASNSNWGVLSNVTSSANQNTITINGSAIGQNSDTTDLSGVHGGYAIANSAKSLYNATATAQYNHVTINNNTTVGGTNGGQKGIGTVYGGYTRALALSSGDSTSNSSYNTVTINDGIIGSGAGSVYGGSAASRISGNNTATANNNTVVINGGTIGQNKYGVIFGGYADAGSTDTVLVTRTSYAYANSNQVTITNGTIGGTNASSSGTASEVTSIYGGFVLFGKTAEVKNNTVTIAGQNVKFGSASGSVYGGYVQSSTKATAENNTVNIGCSVDADGNISTSPGNAINMTNATFYGSNVAGTGNTLNIFTTGNTIKGIGAVDSSNSFQKMNFYIQGNTNTASLLTVTDAITANGLTMGSVIGLNEVGKEYKLISDSNGINFTGAKISTVGGAQDFKSGEHFNQELTINGMTNVYVEAYYTYNNNELDFSSVASKYYLYANSDITATVSLTSPLDAQNKGLTIADGGALSLQGLTNAGTVINNGTLTATTIDVTSGSLTNNGTLTATTIDVTSDSLTNNGTLTMTGNNAKLDIKVNGTFTNNNSANITTIANAGTVNINSAMTIASLTNTGTINSDVDNFKVTSGNITNNGTINLTADGTTDTFNASFAGSGTLNLSSSDAKAHTFSYTNTNANALDNAVYIAEGVTLDPNANVFGEDITNYGTLVLEGTDVAGTLSVNVTGAGTTQIGTASTAAQISVAADKSITQKNVTIANSSSSLTIAADKLSTSAGVSNAGTLNLTGGTTANLVSSSNTITGTGTVNIGTTGSTANIANNGSITQNTVNINAGSSLTSNEDNITATVINNNATYNVNGGTIAANTIKADSTTKGTLNIIGDTTMAGAVANQNITVGTDTKAASLTVTNSVDNTGSNLTLNSGSTLNMKSSEGSTATVGTLTVDTLTSNNGIITFDAGFFAKTNGATTSYEYVTDNVKINTSASGTINLGSINITADQYTGNQSSTIFRLIYGTNDAFNNGLTINGTTSSAGAYVYTFKQVTSVDTAKLFGKYYGGDGYLGYVMVTRTVGGTLADVVQNKKLETGTELGSVATYSLIDDTTTEKDLGKLTYVTNQNARTFTVNGNNNKLTSGNTSYGGIYVAGSTDSLTLKDITLQGFGVAHSISYGGSIQATANGAFYNAAGATTTLQNVTFAGTVASADVENLGTLNALGTVVFDKAIGGSTGTLNLGDGITVSTITTTGSLSQGTINIKANAEVSNSATITSANFANAGTLTTDAGKLIASNSAITNTNGIINLTGGTLARGISGGSLNITGKVTANAKIAVNDLSVAKDQGLTLDVGNLDAANTIQNSGTITLTADGTTDTFNESFSGEGKVQFSLANGVNSAIVQYTADSENALNNTITIDRGVTLDPYAYVFGKDITNYGTLVLKGTGDKGKLSVAVTGSGTLQIGTTESANVVASKNITQSAVQIMSGSSLDNDGVLTASVTNAGTLTSNASNVKGTINNTGVYNVEGGAISYAVNATSGTGTVNIKENTSLNTAVTNQTINVEAGKELAISKTLNNTGSTLSLGNAATLDMKDNAYETLTVDKLLAPTTTEKTVAANWEIDASLNSGASTKTGYDYSNDKIVVTNSASGTINLASVNIINDAYTADDAPVSFCRVIEGTDTSLAGLVITDTTTVSGKYKYTFTQTTASEKDDLEKYEKYLYGDSYSVDGYQGYIKIVRTAAGTLAMVIQNATVGDTSLGTIATYSLSGDEQTVDNSGNNVDLGTLTRADANVARTFTINGNAHTLTSTSTQHGGVILNTASSGVGDTLNIRNIAMDNFATAITNGSGSTVNLDTVTFTHTDNTITGDNIANDGSLTTNNAVTLDRGISGTGSLTVTGGTTEVSGSLTQNKVVVNTGATLTANGKLIVNDTADGALTNSGTLNLYGNNNIVEGNVVNNGSLNINGRTELKKGVSGTGTTNVADATTIVSINFSQGGLNVGNTATADLTGANISTTDGSGVISNAGTLQLSGTSTLDNITDSGTTEIKNGYATVKGNVSQTSLTVDSGAVYTQSAGNITISGNIINNGTLSLDNTATTVNVTGSLTNNKTLTNKGTVRGSVSNTSGATLTNTGTLEGSVSNAHGATLTSSGAITGSVDNSGTLNLTGTNMLTTLTDTTTTAVGVTTINDGSTVVTGAFKQRTISIGTGAGATLNLDNFTLSDDRISNEGSLTFTGGTSSKVVTNSKQIVNTANAASGNGILNFGDGSAEAYITNNAALTQNTVNVKAKAVVTNAAAITATNISNAGKLTTDAVYLRTGNAVNNTGSLIITGDATDANTSGVLSRIISGGAVAISGNILSSVAIKVNSLNVGTNNTLTLDVDNLEVATTISNAGIIKLVADGSGDTFDETFGGDGTVHFALAAETNAATVQYTADSKNALNNLVTIDADLNLDPYAYVFGKDITNAGTLVLEGTGEKGILSAAIKGNGTTKIGSTGTPAQIVANANISQNEVDVLAGNSLTNNAVITVSEKVDNAGTLNNSATGSINGNVTNSSTLTNAGIITGAVTNSGTSSTLTNTGTINGNVTNAGTLTSNASNINGTVTNTGTYNVEGGTIDSSHAIATGTTGTVANRIVNIQEDTSMATAITDQTINVAAGKSLTITSDVNNSGSVLNLAKGSTLDMKLNGYDNITVDKLTAPTNTADAANLTIDGAIYYNNSSITYSTDTIKVNTSGSGNINLSEVNIVKDETTALGAGASICFQLISGDSGELQNLVINSTTSSLGSFIYKFEQAQASDTVAAGTDYHGYVKVTRTAGGTLPQVVQNSLPNVDLGTISTYSLLNDYTTDQKLGVLTNSTATGAADRSLTINGNGRRLIAGADASGTTFGGVYVPLNKTLTLKNIKVQGFNNAKDSNGNDTGGSFYNASGANMYLDNVTFSDTEGIATIQNEGSLQSDNVVSIDKGISGGGTLTVASGTTTLSNGGSLTQGKLVVNNGATLTANGEVTVNDTADGAITNRGTLNLYVNNNTVKGSVVNDGSLNIKGHTELKKGISGTGTTTVADDTTIVSINFSQGGLEIGNTATADLTGANISMTDGSGVITNNGTLQLSGTSTLDNITGSGTTEIKNGNATVKGNVSQTSLTVDSEAVYTQSAGNVSINGNLTNSGTMELNSTTTVTGSLANTGTLTNKGTLSGAITNAGTFTNSGTLTGSVANAGTLNLSGTGTLTEVAGTTGTTNVTGGTTTVENAFQQKTLKVDDGSIKLDLSKLAVTDAISNDGTITFTGGSSATYATLSNDVSSITAHKGTLNLGDGDSAAYINTRSVLKQNTINIQSKAVVNNSAVITANSFNNAGSLSTNADNITASTNAINNAGGSITLTGGTLQRGISGGALAIAGAVSSAKMISVSSLNVGAAKSLTLAIDDLAVTSVVQNAGTITLKAGTDTNLLEESFAGDGAIHFALADGVSAATIIYTADSKNALDNLVTIDEGLSLDPYAYVFGEDITNTGTLILEGTGDRGILSVAIKGNGTTKIGSTGTTAQIVANANITQNNVEISKGSSLTNNAIITASVNNSGELTSDASKLVGAVTNSGTYNITGGTVSSGITSTESAKGTINITGDTSMATAVSNQTINVATDTQLAITKNMANTGTSLNLGDRSTLDMKDGSYETLTVDTLTASTPTDKNDAAKLEIDASLNAGAATTTGYDYANDKIVVNSSASGSINLYSVNIMNDAYPNVSTAPTTFCRVIYGSDETLKNLIINGTTTVSGAYQYTFTQVQESEKAALSYYETYLYGSYSGGYQGYIKIIRTSAGTLAEIIQNLKGNSDTTLGTIATYSLSADEEAKYSNGTAADLGTLTRPSATARTLTINGNGYIETSTSTEHGGITVANAGDVLNLKNLTMNNFSVAVTNASGATVNLDNVTFQNTVTNNTLVNNGTLNASDAVNLDKNLTGTGSLTVNIGTTNVGGSLSQKDVTVNKYASLTAQGSFTATGAVSNSGTLNMNGTGNNSVAGLLTNTGTLSLNGTTSLTSGVTGEGTTTIASGKTTVATSFIQSGLNLVKGAVAELSNASITNIGKTAVTANAGTLVLHGTSTLDTVAGVKAANGTTTYGTLTVGSATSSDDALTVSGNLTQSGLTVGNNAKYTQTAGSATINGNIINSGNLTLESVVTTNVNGNVVNSSILINNGALSVAGAIINTGTLKLAGTNTLGQVVDSTDIHTTANAGTIELTGGTTTINEAFIQKYIIVDSGATGIFDLSWLPTGTPLSGAEVSNEGTITFKGGTSDNHIINNLAITATNGGGTFNLGDGDNEAYIENAGTITQNTLNINAKVTVENRGAFHVTNLNNAGSLTTSAGNLGTGNTVVNTNGTITLNDTASGTLSRGIKGGNLIINGASGSISSAYLMDVDSLTVGSNSSLILTDVDNLNVATAIQNNGTITLMADGAGNDSFDELFRGAGTLTLNGSGTIKYTADSLGAMDNAITISSGVTLDPLAYTFAKDITNNGTLVLEGTGEKGALTVAVTDSGKLQIGDTNIVADVVTNKTISQRQVKVVKNSSLTNKGGITATVDNAGTLVNNAVITGTVTNSGTLTNDGTVATAYITGAVTNTGTLTSNADAMLATVTNDGTYNVTGGTLKNISTSNGKTGTLNINGDTALAQATLSNQAITVAENKSLTVNTNVNSGVASTGTSLTLENNATLNMIGGDSTGRYNKLTVDSLTVANGSTANWNFDAELVKVDTVGGKNVYAYKVDTIQANTLASGSINLASINLVKDELNDSEAALIFANTGGAYFQLVSGTDAALSTLTINSTTAISGHYMYTLEQVKSATEITNFNSAINYYYGSTVTSYTEGYKGYVKVTRSEAGSLAQVVQAKTIGSSGTSINLGTVATYSLVDATYKTSENLGSLTRNSDDTSVPRNLTINGNKNTLQSGDSSTYGTFGGVYVANRGDSLTLKDVTVKGFASAKTTDGAATSQGAFYNSVGASTYLDAVTFTDTKAAYTIENNGYLNTDNTVALDKGITGAGSLTVNSGTTNVGGSLGQKNVTVNKYASLTAQGSFVASGDVSNSGTLNMNGTESNGIAGTLTNTGELNLKGTTSLAGGVEGTGTTTIASGKTTVGTSFVQGSLIINSGATAELTNASMTNSSKTVVTANAGTLVLHGTSALDTVAGVEANGTTSYGTLTVGSETSSSDTLTVSGNITQSGLIVGKDAKYTQTAGSATINGNIINNGNLALESVVTTNVSGNVVNTGTLTNNGALSVSGAIVNTGTLKLAGTNTLGQIVDSTESHTTASAGTIELTGGTTTIDKAFIQENIIVDSGATGIFDLSWLPTDTPLSGANVRNEGTMTFKGGTSASHIINSLAINGGGTFNLGDGDNEAYIENAGTITQNTLNINAKVAVENSGAFKVTNLNNAGSLTTSAGNLGTGNAVVNTGTITINDVSSGTLSRGITGGALIINGAISSDNIMDVDNLTVGSSSALTIADVDKLNVVTAIQNSGTITLTADETGNDTFDEVFIGDGVLILKGIGTIKYTADSLGAIGNAITISSGVTLDPLAYTFAKDITNDGILVLEGTGEKGALTVAVTGNGTLKLGDTNIVADVVTNKTISQSQVNVVKNSSLTNEGGITAAVDNAGTLVNNAAITGAVTNTGTLTSNADTITGTVTNDGTYNVTGGTLKNISTSNGKTGTLNINGDTTLAQSTLSNQNITVAENKSLTVNTNVNSGVDSTGTSLTLNNNATLNMLGGDATGLYKKLTVDSLTVANGSANWTFDAELAKTGDVYAYNVDTIKVNTLASGSMNLSSINLVRDDLKDTEATMLEALTQGAYFQLVSGPNDETAADQALENLTINSTTTIAGRYMYVLEQAKSATDITTFNNLINQYYASEVLTYNGGYKGYVKVTRTDSEASTSLADVVQAKIKQKGTTEINLGTVATYSLVDATYSVEGNLGTLTRNSKDLSTPRSLTINGNGNILQSGNGEDYGQHGGIYVANRGDSLTLKDVTVQGFAPAQTTDGKTTSKGAFYNGVNATTNLDGLTFKDTKADYDIENAGYLNTDNTVTLDKGIIGTGTLTVTSGTTTVANSFKQSGLTILTNAAADLTNAIITNADQTAPTANAGTLTLHGTSTLDTVAGAGSLIINDGTTTVNSGLEQSSVNVDDGAALLVKGNFAVSNDVTVGTKGSLTLHESELNNSIGGTLTNNGTVNLNGSTDLNTASGNGTMNVNKGTVTVQSDFEQDNLYVAEGTTFKQTSGSFNVNQTLESQGTMELNIDTMNLYGRTTMNNLAGTIDTMSFFSTGNSIDNLSATVNNMKFYIPAAAVAGSTMLTVNQDLLDLSNTNVKAGVQTGSRLANGDKINLITNLGGSIKAPDSKHMEIIEEVGFNEYKLGISLEGSSNLVATVSGSEASPDAKSPLETMAASVTMVNEGSDMLATVGLENAVTAAAQSDIFAALSNSVTRINSGSNVDLKGKHFVIGYARDFANANGKLVVGPVVEYGQSAYDSYLDTGFHAEGNSKYVGAGLVAKQLNNNGVYYEGSLRGGKTMNDYSSDVGDYDTNAFYLAAHLGLGKVLQLKNNDSLDVYGKYFYTYQRGSDATNANDEFDFDSNNSHRLRLGFRYNHSLSAMNSFYGGLAWQYEFSGECAGSISGNETASPSLKGHTGIVELGWKVQPNKNFDFNLGLSAYTGVEHGASVNMKLDWKF